MRQDDRAPFDRALHRARVSAYAGDEFVGQEGFMTAGEIRALAVQVGVGPGVTVLDLCCGIAGPGRFLTRELGCLYLGVDASASAVALAREQTGDLPCRFAVAQVPPLPAGSFDVVLLLETMLAFEDKDELVHEIAEALRPAGRFAFTLEEGPPLTTAERAAMPDADSVWLTPLDEIAASLDRAGLVVTWLQDHSRAHRATAQALAGAFAADAADIAAQIGHRALDELLAAHRLWVEWLDVGRVRKLALVAERASRPPGVLSFSGPLSTSGGERSWQQERSPDGVLRRANSWAGMRGAFDRLGNSPCTCLSRPVKALITGGAGFIGSHVADSLVAGGHEVHVVDNLSTGRLANLETALEHGAELHTEDVTDAAWMTDLMAILRPDVVFHLAAQIDVRRSVDDPAFDAGVNVAGTVAVLDAARRAGARRLVLASTAAVYGQSCEIPTTEAAPVAPLSPYGASKAAAESYLALFSRMHGLSTLALRMANVYGPRQDPCCEAGVVAIFSAAAAAGTPAVVYGDGHQTRDYVHVFDVAAAFVTAGRSAVTGVLNVSTGHETPVLEVANGLCLAVEYARARRGEIMRSCLSPAEAHRTLGWRARTPLREGLERLRVPEAVA